MFICFQPTNHRNHTTIFQSEELEVSLHSHCCVTSGQCGEIASPSPLKSPHKRVRLPGWTSPLSHILGKPKRHSQYVFGCHRKQTCQTEAYRQCSIKAKHVSLLRTQLKQSRYVDHNDDGEALFDTFVDDVVFEPTYSQALSTAAGRNVATLTLYCRIVCPDFQFLLFICNSSRFRCFPDCNFYFYIVFVSRIVIILVFRRYRICKPSCSP